MHRSQRWNRGLDSFSLWFVSKRIHFKDSLILLIFFFNGKWYFWAKTAIKKVNNSWFVFNYCCMFIAPLLVTSVFKFFPIRLSFVLSRSYSLWLWYCCLPSKPLFSYLILVMAFFHPWTCHCLRSLPLHLLLFDDTSLGQVLNGNSRLSAVRLWPVV